MLGSSQPRPSTNALELIMPPAFDEKLVTTDEDKKQLRLITIALAERFVNHLFDCKPEAHIQDGLPPLSEFIYRIIRRTNASLTTLFVALIYLIRLKQKHPACKGTQSSPHRLLLAAIIISYKYLYDNCYHNRSWAQVSQGLFKLEEINKMEVELLFFLGFQLYVSKIHWSEFVEFMDGKLTRSLSQSSHQAHLRKVLWVELFPTNGLQKLFYFTNPASKELSTRLDKELDRELSKDINQDLDKRLSANLKSDPTHPRKPSLKNLIKFDSIKLNLDTNKLKLGSDKLKSDAIRSSHPELTKSLSRGVVKSLSKASSTRSTLRSRATSRRSTPSLRSTASSATQISELSSRHSEINLKSSTSTCYGNPTTTTLTKSIEDPITTTVPTTTTTVSHQRQLFHKVSAVFTKPGESISTAWLDLHQSLLPRLRRRSTHSSSNSSPPPHPSSKSVLATVTIRSHRRRSSKFSLPPLWNRISNPHPHQPQPESTQ